MRDRLNILSGVLGLTLAVRVSSSLAADPKWLSGSYDERLRAIRHAGPVDAAALESFLSTPAVEGEVNAGELSTLKNEAGMVLLGLPHLPETLAHRFLALAGDPSTDPVWRDYCVQFLGMGFPKWSAADRKTVVSFLVDVAQKGKGATGGTALIALYYNVSAPEIGFGRVSALALWALKDASYGDAGRISVLQVCAGLNVVDALPDARTLAASSTTIRASAIAAIGALGDRSDAVALRDWAQSTDQSIRVPAVAALKRIEERFSGHITGVRP